MTSTKIQGTRLGTGAVRVGQTLLAVGLVVACSWATLSLAQYLQNDLSFGTTVAKMTHVLGRPTDTSISVNVLSPDDLEVFAEYGTAAGSYSGKTGTVSGKARIPVELSIARLKPDTRYYYRLRYRRSGSGEYITGTEYSFHTQRLPGSQFVFDVQADSHPERLNRMFNAELYARTMVNVRRDNPDFYITLGDDFSIDQLGNRPLTPTVVSQIYIDQRPFLSQEGAGTPIFLVNGNHEQAAKYLLNGTPNSPAVWAGKARNAFFPQPTIGDGKFYTGDLEPVEHVGLLNDYYAWTWGDALFITLDPYWHSDVVVDNRLGEGPTTPAADGMAAADAAGGMAGMAAADTAVPAGLPAGETSYSGMGGRDIWGITHGESQYRWLERTLRESKAKYKFIFAHHVLGTGRGGVDMADQGEWGGKNLQGVWEFDKKRPGWDLPIHQLMVKYHVSAFFQGHDHFFVRQEKDGVVYQETPNPANPNYEDSGGWRSAYKTGDYLPASGHLRVTVTPQAAKVDYVRSWMPKDETAEHKQGEVAFSYTIKPYVAR
jgi:hypothetical protein